MPIKLFRKVARPATQEPAAPQSHMRIRPPEPTLEELEDALWQRYAAGQITIEQATDLMKQASLAEARKDLDDEAYETLAKFMRDMPLPAVE